VTLKTGFIEVTRVIEIGAIRKLGCNFLFALYTRPTQGCHFGWPWV